MGLGHELKTNYWLELNTVYSTIKEIAEEIRQDYRRKNPALVSRVSHKLIEAIIVPLSSLVSERYSDEKTQVLLATAVRKIQLMALEIERFGASKYVAILKQLAQQLVNCLPPDEGVQLELFERYEAPESFSVPKVALCFKQWLNGLNWENIKRAARERVERANRELQKFYQPLICGFTCQ